MNETQLMEKQAKQWVFEISTYIRSASKEVLKVDTKSNASDLVTNVDKEVEQYFIQQIKNTYPTHYVLGEEGFGDQLETEEGTIWIIDPIDGTMNFVHQQRHFAISLAVYRDGMPLFGMIYDVMSNDLYHASHGQGAYLNDKELALLHKKSVEESVVGVNATWLLPNRYMDDEALRGLVQAARGTRSYGSAAIEMAYVATGMLDGYITPRLSPWDFAAGIIIAKEVGAIVTDISGNEINILKNSGLVIACEGVHEQLLCKYVKMNSG